MEIKRGVKYRIDRNVNHEEFLRAVLDLTRAKSELDGVVYFRTYTGSGTVFVILDDESKEHLLTDEIGVIISKTPVDVYEIDENVIGEKEYIISQMRKKQKEFERDYSGFDYIYYFKFKNMESFKLYRKNVF